MLVIYMSGMKKAYKFYLKWKYIEHGFKHASVNATVESIPSWRNLIFPFLRSGKVAWHGVEFRQYTTSYNNMASIFTRGSVI